MESKGYLVTAICTLYAVAVSAQESATWDSESHVAKQGENFSITCTVTNVGLFDIVQIAKEDPETNSIQVVSHREHVKEPFFSTNRYNVSYNHAIAEKTVTMQLHYKGVVGEDSGKLICQKMSNENVPKGNLELRVQVPVKDISVTMINFDGTHSTVPEGQVLTLTEEVEVGMGCRASVQGSLTPPEMRIYIDNVEQNAEDFVPTPTSESDNPGSGIASWTAEMLREYKTSTPDPEANGKTLRCEADMEGYESAVATANIVVQYAPRVTCQRYKYYSALEGSVEMTCDVKGNPVSDISWSRSEDYPEEGEGEAENVLESELAELVSSTEDIDDYHKRTTLHIKSVEDGDFGNYYLHATNDLDNKITPLTLTKSATPELDTEMSNTEADNPGQIEPQSVKGNTSPLLAASAGLVTLSALLHVWVR